MSPKADHDRSGEIFIKVIVPDPIYMYVILQAPQVVVCAIRLLCAKKGGDPNCFERSPFVGSYRIAHLTEHLKSNKHDYVTRRSLLKLVGKRRRVLDYLKAVDIERYRAIVKELGLRR